MGQCSALGVRIGLQQSSLGLWDPLVTTDCLGILTGGNAVHRVVSTWTKCAGSLFHPRTWAESFKLALQ